MKFCFCVLSFVLAPWPTRQNEEIKFHFFVLATCTTRQNEQTKKWKFRYFVLAFVAKFYGLLWLIRSVWEHQHFPFKIDWNSYFVGLLQHPFWLQLYLALFGHHIATFKLLCWFRITDEGPVPEMRIWSILLIKSDLKWCIPLSSKSLFTFVLSRWFLTL